MAMKSIWFMLARLGRQDVRKIQQGDGSSVGLSPSLDEIQQMNRPLVGFDELNREKLYDVLSLVRDVFMEFEAPDYTDEGIEEFLDFLDPDSISAMLDDGEMRIWTCECDGEIVGCVAGRKEHINLLFVHGKFHRRGIARRLVEIFIDNYRPAVITVNSSPYAIEAYRRLGFVETGVEKVENGIRFTPMRRELTIS